MVITIEKLSDNKTITAKNRIAVIDFTRGMAISIMVVYHLLFTFGGLLGFKIFSNLYVFFEDTPLVPLFAGLFILISGISSSFSRSNIRRGIKTLLAALLTTTVTSVIMPLAGYKKLGIYFGVLHFMSAAMLLSPLLIKAAKKIKMHIGIPACAILFILTKNTSAGYIGLTKNISLAIPEVLRNAGFLFPLGIRSETYRSADYYPLLPWIFIFIIGIYIGIAIKDITLPRYFYKTISRPIESIGRHTLYIYLAHQPLIFFTGLILKWLINKL